MTPADDDKKEQEPESGGAAGESNRPTPTFKLEAEEVGASRDGTGDDASKGSEPAEAAAGMREPGASQSAGPGAQNGRAERSAGSRIGSFFSHMAAGLLGGAIGVGAALFGLDRLALIAPDAEAPAGASTGATAGGPSNAGLRALREEVEALSGKLEKDLKAVESRFAGLGKASEGDANGGDLAARLAKVETALAGRAEADGGPANPVLAELRQEVDALKEQAAEIKTQSGELAQTIGRLGDSSDGAEQGEAAAAAATSAFDGRVNALETRLASLSEQQDAAIDQGKLAARAVALSALDQAAASGRSFTLELDTLKSVMTSEVRASGSTKNLEAQAAKGVQSLIDLAARFARASRAAQDAANAPQSDALLDQITSRARSLVRVRPSQPQAGESVGAVLSRMQAALEAKNLRKAVDEAAALKGAASDALKPWVEAAKSRLAVDREIAGLRRAMLGEIARPEDNG